VVIPSKRALHCCWFQSCQWIADTEVSAADSKCTLLGVSAGPCYKVCIHSPFFLLLLLFLSVVEAEVRGKWSSICAKSAPQLFLLFFSGLQAGLLEPFAIMQAICYESA
jgi:hypothetical protein